MHRVRNLLPVLTTILIVALLCIPVAKGGKPVGAVSTPILLEWRKDSFVPPEIRVASETGSGLKTINGSADLLRGGRARWSPNGQLVGGYLKAVRDAQGNLVDRGLMAMNADGSGETRIISENEFNAWNRLRQGVESSEFASSFYLFPNWLGNDAMLVEGTTYYVNGFWPGDNPNNYRTGGVRLYVVSAAGIEPVTEAPLANGQWWEDFDPHWSPALNKIVFVSDRTEGDELYAINPDGSELVQITNFGGQYAGDILYEMSTPAWNPAGTRIAVTVKHRTLGLRVWILEVDLSQGTPGEGGRVRSVTPFLTAGTTSVAEEESPAWSPSGDRLVFSRYVYSTTGRSTQSRQIVIANVTSGADTVIINSQKQAPLFPDWRPTP